MNVKQYFIIFSLVIVSLVLITNNDFLADALKAGFVKGIDHVIINGIYSSVCHILCYDLAKNPNTEGYDPEFLKTSEVKQACFESGDFAKGLGYCDKKFGTI